MTDPGLVSFERRIRVDVTQAVIRAVAATANRIAKVTVVLLMLILPLSFVS
jgi:hypothetical protein